MRLPYLQLADKFLSSQSKVIAKQLGIGRPSAIGLGVQLFAFALDYTSTENTPPTGIFVGDDTVSTIEAGMDWDGEEGRAFGAFVRAGVIEAMENGARVKGCDRYEKAWWHKDTPDPEAEADRISAIRAEAGRKGVEAKRQQNVSKPSAKPSKPSANRQQEPSKTTHVDVDVDVDGTETDKKPPQQQEAEVFQIPQPEEFEADSTGEFRPTAWGFWGWHNTERAVAELFEDTIPINPKTYKAWHDAAKAKVGISKLILAYQRYLTDPAFADRGWPFPVFMSDQVWLPRANEAPKQPPPKKAWR